MTYQDYLFIGGPLDGKVRSVLSPSQSVVTAYDNERSTYTRRTAYIGGEFIDVMVFNELDDEAASELLVKNYQLAIQVDGELRLENI